MPPSVTVIMSDCPYAATAYAYSVLVGFIRMACICIINIQARSCIDQCLIVYQIDLSQCWGLPTQYTIIRLCRIASSLNVFSRSLWPSIDGPMNQFLDRHVQFASPGCQEQRKRVCHMLAQHCCVSLRSLKVRLALSAAHRTIVRSGQRQRAAQCMLRHSPPLVPKVCALLGVLFKKEARPSRSVPGMQGRPWSPSPAQGAQWAAATSSHPRTGPGARRVPSATKYRTSTPYIPRYMPVEGGLTLAPESTPPRPPHTCPPHRHSPSAGPPVTASAATGHRRAAPL